MAHINGIQGSKDYAQQFGDFARKTEEFQDILEITIRRPHVANVQNDLNPSALRAQQAMQNDNENWAEMLTGSEDNVTIVDRKLYTGDMIMYSN